MYAGRRSEGETGRIMRDSELPIVDPFPEEDLVPSPGGWRYPESERPGWDWVPPGGAFPLLDRMPLWLRLMYRLPLVDRKAHVHMWFRGGFLVLPPGHSWLQEM